MAKALHYWRMAGFLIHFQGYLATCGVSDKTGVNICTHTPVRMNSYSPSTHLFPRPSRGVIWRIRCSPSTPSGGSRYGGGERGCWCWCWCCVCVKMCRTCAVYILNSPLFSIHGSHVSSLPHTSTHTHKFPRAHTSTTPSTARITPPLHLHFLDHTPLPPPPLSLTHSPHHPLPPFPPSQSGVCPRPANQKRESC